VIHCLRCTRHDHSGVDATLNWDEVYTQDHAGEQRVRRALLNMPVCTENLNPDVGGSGFFAKQLNDARDVLFGQRAR
jgi:hypothetical protein